MAQILNKLRYELKLQAAATVSGLQDAFATNEPSSDSAEICQLEKRVMLSATPMGAPADPTAVDDPSATPVN